jgi:glutaredoxin
MKTHPIAIVYTRQGCHLCEVAEALLQEEGFDVTPVDIDANPELKERYDRCVPVVVIDGRERFRGKVDRKLLRRLARSIDS